MTQTAMTATWFNPQQGHASLNEHLWPWAKSMMLAGHRLTVTLAKEKRSNAQNRVLWSRLGDVSRDVEWYGRKLTPADWKHVFSASLAKMDVVPNLEGTGFVALGLSTSAMTRGELQDLNELILAFGSERSVNWCVASLCGDVDPPDTLPPARGRAKLTTIDAETGEISC